MTTSCNSGCGDSEGLRATPESFLEPYNTVHRYGTYEGRGNA